MERRKILLGTGATVVTAIAGCLGSGDGDDGDSSGPEDDGSRNGDDGSGTGDGDDKHRTDDLEIPGCDNDRVESALAKYGITVKSYTYEDGHVDVTLRTNTKLERKLRDAKDTPEDELRKLAKERFKQIVGSFENAITDEKKLKSGVDSIRIVVVDSDKRRVFDVTADVDDLLKLLEEIDDWDDLEDLDDWDGFDYNIGDDFDEYVDD